MPIPASAAEVILNVLLMLEDETGACCCAPVVLALMVVVVLLVGLFIIMDEDEDDEVAPPPPPPPMMLMNGVPPPPPLPGFGIPSNNDSNNQARANLLNAISSGGFKLKKVDPKEKILSKLANNNPNGMKVPSLSDIQGALARLKKVEMD